MKTTRKTVARLLPLLVLLALGPLSCTDAGDEPGGPTGPASEYNPEMDYSGASITVTASPSSPSPGESVTVVATYRDGDGRPVSGASLVISSEAGAYLTTPANPSLTDGNGRASFVVGLATDTPSGTYSLDVYSQPASPLNGASAVGSVGIEVGGGGVATVALSAVFETVQMAVGYASFVATATVTSDCTPVFYYQAGGAGNNTTTWTPTGQTENPNYFTIPISGSVVGTMSVTVRVYCAGNTSAYADSGAVEIAITP